MMPLEGAFIGLFLAVISFVVGLFIAIVFEKLVLGIPILIIGVILGAVIEIYYNDMDISESIKNQTLLESDLKKYSCDDLGKFIIDHTNNYTYNSNGINELAKNLFLVHKCYK